VVRYQAQVELEKSQKILDEEETIITSGKSGSLLVEVGVLLFQPYPFFEGVTISMSDSFDNVSFNFQVNYILVFLGFSKLFIILRVVLTNTVYMSPRCKTITIQPVACAGCMDVSVAIFTPSSAFLRIPLWY
jgi:hypothetical protein